MRKILYCLGFAALLSQEYLLPAGAQGDPVPGGGGGGAPKVEIIEIPKNNGLINALQNFQFQQNQQQSIFNSTAVKTNPTISPLDQRSGLIQNSTNFNIFGVNGLGIGSTNAPQIGNSHLLNNGNLVADARSLANFLMTKPMPFVNIDKEIFPILSHVPPAQLIGAIAMILGLPENQVLDLMSRAANGAFNINQLINLAINIKTQKISLSDAKLALAQIVAPPAKVASATPATTTTQVQTVKLSVTPVSTSTVQTNVVSTNAVPITTSNTVVSNISNTTGTTVNQVPTNVTEITSTKQPSKVPTVTIQSATSTNTASTNSNKTSTDLTNSLTEFMTKTTGQDIDTKLVEVAVAMRDAEDNANKTDIKVTQDQKKDLLNEKIDKINQATNKIENAIKNEKNEKIGNLVGNSVLAPVTGGTANATMTATGTNPSDVAKSFQNAVMTVTGQGASAKAGEVKSVPPDPFQITQAAALGVTIAMKGLPPILTNAVMLKAVLGQFNNTSALATLNKVLSNPNLSKADAQSVVLGFLQASAKPGDLPVTAILNPGAIPSAPAGATGTGITGNIGSTTTTASKPTVASLIGTAIGMAANNPSSTGNQTPAQVQAQAKQTEALVKQLDTFIDQALSNLGGTIDKFNTQLDAIFNAAQQTSNTTNQVMRSRSN